MLQLKAEFWVAALFRRAQSAGAYPCVVRKGDPDAGLVMVKVSQLDGTASVYTPARDFEGERCWRRALDRAPEPEADALLRRETEFDPDAWIVEIEDRQGRTFLTEPMLGGGA